MFFGQFFYRFGVFQENDLARRKHRKRLRLLQRGLRLAAVRGVTRHSPGASGLRNEGLDQMRAARIAQIRFFTQE